MKKRIIWSNRNLDIEDWRDDYREFLEANEIDKDPDDENDLYEYMIDRNNDYFYDEFHYNLNKEIDGRIICLADLGLWDGRRKAHRILDNNINEIMRCSHDYVEIYGDGYNIRATDSHHDGTNYYEFRVIREDRNIENLFNGKEITRKRLNYYTKSLYPYVAKIYGWR